MTKTITKKTPAKKSGAKKSKSSKPAVLDIVVLLDRSGSMQDRRSDHEGGLAAFVAEQHAADSDAWFSLIQFDDQDPCEVVCDRQRLKDVAAIRLLPRGGTPLLDAIGLSIAHVVKRTGDKANVLFVIITDGLENMSREMTTARVQQLIKEHEKQGWRFLYLGANTDAFAEAGKLGTSAMRSANYANSAEGTRMMYGSLSAKARLAQGEVKTSGGIRGQSMNFSQAERDQLSCEGRPPAKLNHLDQHKGTK